ncbi:MAG: hydrolase 1, exosortase A system-associated [Betaproteobacteria bacterium]|nr:hydrolase 1, exosortase A system-associated [Betaproteobacteria bacterium]
MHESALVFPCEGDRLVGVVSAGHRDLGVVIVVGGPQYRAGSHRQFVLLARHLAAQGFPVLRFDVRGMGDSEGAQRPFDALTPDIAAAITALQSQQPQVRRVVLWGLCDGASAALLYLHERPDPRVQGLVLLNPWVRSEASLARTHVKHYYRQRLLQREFWLKLVSGRVAGAAVRGLLDNLRKARGGGGGGGSGTGSSAQMLAFQQRMAAAWQGFAGGILLVLSGNDYTAREFQEFVRADPAWAGAMARPGLTVHEAAGADHTFSRIADRLALELVTADWLKTLR